MSAAIFIRIISILTFTLVVLIGSRFVGKSSRPKKTSLENAFSDPEENNILEILKDAKVSKTKYGGFHDTYFAPYFKKNPNRKNMLFQTFKIDRDGWGEKIKLAGMEQKMSVDELLSLKIIGYAGAFLFIPASIALGFNPILLGLGFVAFFLGSFYPQKMINDKVKERRETIIRELPDFLELLKSVTEAGLNIQDALIKVSMRLNGVVSKEFRLVMAETTANGGGWRAAMENMSERNDTEELSDVIADILISYEKGTSIIDTLAKEASMMRQIKNSRVQEKSKKLTIKLLLPMVIFCFTPLMIMLLTPIFIQMSGQL